MAATTTSLMRGVAVRWALVSRHSNVMRHHYSGGASPKFVVVASTGGVRQQQQRRSRAVHCSSATHGTTTCRASVVYGARTNTNVFHNGGRRICGAAMGRSVHAAAASSAGEGSSGQEEAASASAASSSSSSSSSTSTAATAATADAGAVQEKFTAKATSGVGLGVDFGVEGGDFGVVGSGGGSGGVRVGVLSTGAVLVPHPDKADKGGEDACFVLRDQGGALHVDSS